MSFGASDHRTAAIMLSDAVPGFQPDSLSAWLERAEYQPHTNIGPGQPHWIVRGRDGRAILDRGAFGFTAAVPDKPGQSKLVFNPNTAASRPARSAGGPSGRSGSDLRFNARAETIASRPMFRGAFERRRCLIPADGFFEWERVDRRRLPWWFHRDDGQLLLFAGVFDPPQHDDPARFSIITVPAAGEIARVHDRMPAIIESADVSRWLFDRPTDSLLRPHSERLTAFRVSTRFNAIGHDEAIVPATE
jgi:putative SOS response-associated peptidase YedK